MDTIVKGGAEWSLRVSFALLFLFSGSDIMLHPANWQWAVHGLPESIIRTINSTMGTTLYLRIQGASELFFSYILLAWFLPRWTLGLFGLAIAAEMFAILLMLGVDGVTFRDIGLVGGGIAMLFIALQKN